jgi:hypothetical protein
MTAAMVSIPRLRAFYGEDTQDAFEYLGLTKPNFFPFNTHFRMHSTNAVYAGQQPRPLFRLHKRSPVLGGRTAPVTLRIYASHFVYNRTALAASIARSKAAKYVDEIGKVKDFQHGSDYGLRYQRRSSSGETQVLGEGEGCTFIPCCG